MKTHPEFPVASLAIEFKEPLLKAVRDALDVQDASNLSGVLLTWARYQPVLKDLCGGNNDRYHKHPVNILFLSKVTSLMGVNADCLGGVDGGLKDSTEIEDLFALAYDYCKRNRR